MYKCNIDRLDDKINELNKEKERLLLLGKEKLSKIENGAKFGYIDFRDWEDSYYPCELLEVIDRDKFIIKIREKSINQEEVCDVFGLHIAEED